MGQAFLVQFLVQAPHDCSRRGTGDPVRPATSDANLGSFQLLLRYRRAEHGQSMWLCRSAVSDLQPAVVEIGQGWGSDEGASQRAEAALSTIGRN